MRVLGVLQFRLAFVCFFVSLFFFAFLFFFSVVSFSTIDKVVAGEKL